MDQLKIESLSGRDEGERILKLIGPFTLNAVFEFQAITRQHSPAVTIIDLSEVPYMDSAALGSLLGFQASCHREARRCALVGVCGRIGVLFKVSRVEGLIKCYESLAEAEDALAKEASA
jgi:anti-anti-sigma factor